MPEISENLTKGARKLKDVIVARMGGGARASAKAMLAASIIKGIIKDRLKNTRSDQLWTMIQDGVKPSDVWGDGSDPSLPKGIKGAAGKLSHIIDLKSNFEAIEKALEEDGGEIVMLAIKHTRPDLYKVLANTPGAESMIWHEVRKLREQVRQIVEEVS